jgi:hypothetical protein
MEHTEILAALADSIGEIVDKKVAEKTESVKPTLADAYKMVLDAIDNGTLENEKGLSVTDLLSKIRLAYTCRYDEFVSDNKAEDDSCQSNTAYDTVKEAIENGDLATDEVADLLEAINNESTYDEEVGDLVRNEADNYGLVDKDDVDEEWIFENVSDTTIRDVALRYVNDNL